MCSRAFAAGLGLSLSCCAANDGPASSDTSSLSAPSGQAVESACASPAWRTLHGPRFGHGAEPARHQQPAVELKVESSKGFEVGRSSIVRASQGNQLFVEIKNLENRWRCGIRSYPSVAYDNQGQRIDQPAADTGYTVLGATGMLIATREGVPGNCLGPAETGYLQIRMTKELAKVSVSLEATSDDLQIGPPPTCVVPDGYAYAEGSLSIQAHRAGASDPTYKPPSSSGLAMVLAMDDESLPLAWFSLTSDANGGKDSSPTFTGAVNLNGGTSENLAVLVW